MVYTNGGRSVLGVDRFFHHKTTEVMSANLRLISKQILVLRTEYSRCFRRETDESEEGDWDP